MNDENKFNAPKPVLQFSAEARNQAAKFEAVREAILDWVSQNVLTLDEAERRAAYHIFHDHNVGIAQSENGERLFAIRYTRSRSSLARGPQEDTALKVTTEIVLRAGEKDLSVQLLKSHESRKYARLSTQDLITQPSSILAIIGELLKFEENGYPLMPRMTELDVNSDFMKIGKLLIDPRRSIPVIIALGAEEGRQPIWSKHSMDELARKSYGFAHVLYIPFEAIEFFQKKLGKNWHFKPGQVRQFNPGFQTQDVQTAHPLWPGRNRQSEREELLAEHLHEILSQAPRRRIAPVLTFNSVYQPLVERALVSEINPEHRVALLEAKLNIAEQNITDLNDMLLESFSINEALEKKLAGQGNQSAPPEPKKQSDHKDDKRAQWKVAAYEFGIPVPDQIEHVAAWAYEYFPESLVLCKPFLDECKRTKKISPARTKNFYKVLTIMGIYHGEAYSSDLARRRPLLHGKSLPEIFEKNGFDALQSSDTTLSRYRSEYQVTDPNGTRWNLDWHVKDGSRDPQNMLRIYYADSATEGERGNRPPFIVIGKGPHHLPTLTG